MPSQEMPKPAQSGQGADIDIAAALYERSGAAAYDVSAEQFAAILDEILRKYLFQNSAQNSAANSSHISAEQKAAFCAALRLEELALARACAAGNERAWQDFINRYRKQKRTVSLEEQTEEGVQFVAAAEPARASDHISDQRLESATDEALAELSSEDRFTLASYYLDGRTLAEIARALGLHESSVSRRLDRLATGLRKRILAGLRMQGMSHAQATEALATDVRDLQLNLRSRLTQDSGAKPFPGRKVPAQDAGDGSAD